MSAYRSIRQSLNIIANQLISNTVLANVFGVTDLIVTNITATAAQHLTILGVTGKDIIVKLTDASGARKLIIKDSADATVASIDSDGKYIGVNFTGDIIGDVTGDVTGDLTGDVTGNADTATQAEGVDSVESAGITTVALTAALGDPATLADGLTVQVINSSDAGAVYLVTVYDGDFYLSAELAAAA